MKKLISYGIFVSMLLLSLLPGMALAADPLTATLEVEISDTSVDVGDTFTATLKFTNLTAQDSDGEIIPVFAYRIQGTYGKAEITSVRNLGTEDEQYEAVNQYGDGELLLWNTIDTQNEDGAFYEITFEATESGTFAMNLSQVEAMREMTIEEIPRQSATEEVTFEITKEDIPTVTISGSGGGSTGGGGTGGGGTGGSGSGGGNSGGNSGGISVNPGTGNTQTTTEKFIDLDNYAWAKEYIYKLSDAGIIKGISDTEFGPANEIRRGDFMLILARMLEINDPFTENFADVPEGSYYYDAIGSAKAAGIAQGSGENFMPENPITRQDLITLAYRVLVDRGMIEETTDTTVLDQFADKGNISEYALAPLASMVAQGIIQGADGYVNPTNTATRAEVAVMCARIYDLIN